MKHPELCKPVCVGSNEVGNVTRFCGAWKVISSSISVSGLGKSMVEIIPWLRSLSHSLDCHGQGLVRVCEDSWDTLCLFWASPAVVQHWEGSARKWLQEACSAQCLHIGSCWVVVPSSGLNGSQISAACSSFPA